MMAQDPSSSELSSVCRMVILLYCFYPLPSLLGKHDRLLGHHQSVHSLPLHLIRPPNRLQDDLPSFVRSWTIPSWCFLENNQYYRCSLGSLDHRSLRSATYPFSHCDYDELCIGWRRCCDNFQLSWVSPVRKTLVQRTGHQSKKRWETDRYNHRASLDLLKQITFLNSNVWGCKF